MPYRKTVFAENGIYHVINRGVNRSPIFKCQTDYAYCFFVNCAISLVPKLLTTFDSLCKIELLK